ncbi:MAG: T9SS type A sorting domain-containing protein [Bacteroidetes bacterium]|nr:T9SS type A sorting domain-containing protein [Bacteroidota bacterium]
MKKIYIQIVLLLMCSYAKAQNQFTNNGNFKISNGANITFYGDVLNNGSFVDSGQVVNMSGTSGQNIGGSSAITFKNLTVLSANNITLNNGMTVSNVLTLTTGYVTLGTNDLTIGSNGSISGGSNASFIVTNGTGLLRQQNIGSGGRTGAVFFPVAYSASSTSYSPITLDNSTGTADRFDVKVCNYISTGGTCNGSTQISSNTVNNTWTINEATAGGSNASVTAQWNGSEELSGFDRTNCFISHHNGTKWDALQSEGTSSGINPYTRSVTGISNFSPFGVGSVGSPLPIELIIFEAKPNNKSVDLHWETATEINNDYFTIERSVDGVHFEELMKVKGAGNSSTSLNYYTEDNNPVNGLSYYRLKQTDYDGKSQYSGIVNIEFIGDAIIIETYYDSGINIMLSGLKDEKGEIIINDMLGEKYYSKVIVVSNAATLIKINESLPAAAYIVTFITDKKMYSKKIIVK